MTNPITRLDFLRNTYKAQSPTPASEEARELKEIKTELRIANDENAREDVITKALTHSPYLTDQAYYNKETIYNSPKETDWKEVRSYEESRQQVAVFRNLRKLNII